MLDHEQYKINKIIKEKLSIFFLFLIPDVGLIFY